MGPSDWERSRVTKYPFMSYRLYLYLRESFINRSTFDHRQGKIFKERKRGSPLELCERVPYVDYNYLTQPRREKGDSRAVVFRIGHIGSHQPTYDSTGQWHNVWHIRYNEDPYIEGFGTFAIKRAHRGVYLTDQAAVEAAMAARRGDDVVIIETMEDVLNYLLLVSTT